MSARHPYADTAGGSSIELLVSLLKSANGTNRLQKRWANCCHLRSSQFLAAYLGALTMANLSTVEIKAFLPAKDFDLSKRFYKELGFDLDCLARHLREIEM